MMSRNTLFAFVAGFAAAMVVARTTSAGKQFVSGGNRFFTNL